MKKFTCDFQQLHALRELIILVPVDSICRKNKALTEWCDGSELGRRSWPRFSDPNNVAGKSQAEDIGTILNPTNGNV